MNILYFGPEEKGTLFTKTAKVHTNADFTYTGYLNTASSLPEYEQVSNYDYLLIDIDVQSFTASSLENYLGAIIQRGYKSKKIIIKGSGYSQNCELFKRLQSLSINSIISSDIAENSDIELLMYIDSKLYKNIKSKKQNPYAQNAKQSVKTKTYNTSDEKQSNKNNSIVVILGNAVRFLKSVATLNSKIHSHV